MNTKLIYRAMMADGIHQGDKTREWGQSYTQAKDLLNLLSASEQINRTWHMAKSVHLWFSSWWRHQMETFSALLAIYARNSPVPGEFPAQRPVTRSFDVFLDLRLNKRFSKQSWGWWFETLSRPLSRHSNVYWKPRCTSHWPSATKAR